jgi:hypothetical protein
LIESDEQNGYAFQASFGELNESKKLDGFFSFDSLVKSQNLELLPQLIGIAKVVNTPYIVVTKIFPDFLRDHQFYFGIR